MITRISTSKLLFTLLLFILTTLVSSFTYERAFPAKKHILVRRSHPPSPYDGPLLESHYREHIPQEPALEGGRHSPGMHRESHDPHLSSIGVDETQDAFGKALGENGLTRVLYEEEQVPPEDDYYYDEDLFLPPPKHNHEKQKKKETLLPEKDENESFLKKFPKEEKKTDHKKHDLHQPLHRHPDLHHQFDLQPISESETGSIPGTHSYESKDSKEGQEPVTEPSMPVYVPRFMKKDSPHALPVTTEGKTNTKKTEDPLKVYGFPKELLPIMPGGGSRFEDVEREKLEKKKMSQTKGVDDDSAENGSAHEAEGLYSSASLASFSLCFYWLICFHNLDRFLML